MFTLCEFQKVPFSESLTRNFEVDEQELTSQLRYSDMNTITSKLEIWTKIAQVLAQFGIVLKVFIMQLAVVSSGFKSLISNNIRS